jgi:hypothetical protein
MIELKMWIRGPIDAASVTYIWSMFSNNENTGE